MEDLKGQIEVIRKEFTDKILEAKSLKDVDAVRVTFVGKSGKLSLCFKKIKELSDRKSVCRERV